MSTILISAGVTQINHLCGLGLSFTIDGFRILYLGIALFMWLCATLFSKEYMRGEHRKARYYVFWFATLAAVAGILLSADLFTTFIFFEIMSFTSFVWVIQEEKEESIHAGNLYLSIAVFSGLVMLMGIMMLYHELGTLSMGNLQNEINAVLNSAETAVIRHGIETRLFIAACLMLVGFGAKAGLFLLHVWLPKAHTVAPAPASALLSGILTKMGIFGILILSGMTFLGTSTSMTVTWGKLLFVLGLLTMVTGAFLALFSVNLKRTLACSSVSQMGFILVGIAMYVLLSGEGMALNGALLHMVNHSLIKLVLFLCAGIVFMKAGSLNLNDIRGYGRNKPLLHVAFAIGAYSIAGIPLGSGYVSKTLIHESIVEYMELAVGTDSFAYRKAAEIVFLITGGMTLAYMLKLYIAIFLEKGEAEKKPGCKPLTMATVLLPAALLFVMGILPNLSMDKVAEFGRITGMYVTKEAAETIHYFSPENLKGAVISMAIGLVLYFGLIRPLLMKKQGERRVYVDRFPAWIDLEKNVYQPIFLGFLPFVGAFVCRLCDKLIDGIALALRKHVFRAKRKKRPVAVGSGFTYVIGSILDGIVNVLNHTILRRRKIQTSFVNLLAISRAEMDATGKVIARSVSFGLLMFCIGLLLTLSYLLL